MLRELQSNDILLESLPRTKCRGWELSLSNGMKPLSEMGFIASIVAAPSMSANAPSKADFYNISLSHPSLATQYIQRGCGEVTCQEKAELVLGEIISFLTIFFRYCSRGLGIDTKGMDLVGRMQVKQPKICLFLKELCQLVYLFIDLFIYLIYLYIFNIFIFLYIYIHTQTHIYTSILIKVRCCSANVKNPIPNELRTTEEQTECHKNSHPVAQGTETAVRAGLLGPPLLG